MSGGSSYCQSSDMSKREQKCWRRGMLAVAITINFGKSALGVRIGDRSSENGDNKDSVSKDRGGRSVVHIAMSSNPWHYKQRLWLHSLAAGAHGQDSAANNAHFCTSTLITMLECLSWLQKLNNSKGSSSTPARKYCIGFKYYARISGNTFTTTALRSSRDLAWSPLMR